MKIFNRKTVSIMISILCTISMFLVRPLNQKAIYGIDTLVEAKEIIHDKDNNPILIYQGPYSILSQEVSPITEYEVKILGRKKVWIPIPDNRYMPFVIFSMLVFLVSAITVFIAIIESRYLELILWVITSISVIYAFSSI